jgi:hypothetical protein
MVKKERGSLRTPRDFEFLEDITDIVFDGFVTKTEAVGDFLIVSPLAIKANTFCS